MENNGIDDGTSTDGELSRDIDSLEVHLRDEDKLEDNRDDVDMPSADGQTTPPSLPAQANGLDGLLDGTSDTIRLTHEHHVLMKELNMSAEESDSELQRHGSCMAVLAARAKAEADAENAKIKAEVEKMTEAMKKEMEEGNVKVLNEMKKEMKRELSQMQSLARSASNDSRQSRESRGSASRKRKNNDRSLGSRGRGAAVNPSRTSSLNSTRPRYEAPRRERIEPQSPRASSMERAPLRSVIHVMDEDAWEVAGAHGGGGRAGRWEVMSDMDVVDAPDGAGTSGGAGPSGSAAASARLRLASLKPGMSLACWVDLATRLLTANKCHEGEKRAAVLEALLDYQNLYDIVKDRLAVRSTATAVELIEHLKNRLPDYTIQRYRRPNWPVLRDGDSIRTHAGVMTEEARDCGASDSTLRAAFLNSLHGRARTRAKQHFDEHPMICARDLMAHVIGIMEDRETNVDYRLLHSTRQRPDKTADQFGHRLLEEGTRILTARGHNGSQIDDFCLTVFCSNVNPAIRVNMATANPRNLKEAIAIARNIEEVLARDSAQAEKLAAFSRSGPGQQQGRGYNNNYRGRGGRGGQRGGRGGYNNNSSRGANQEGDHGNMHGTIEFTGKCFVCKMDGHRKRDCPVHKANKEAKNSARDSETKEQESPK